MMAHVSLFALLPLSAIFTLSASYRLPFDDADAGVFFALRLFSLQDISFEAAAATPATDAASDFRRHCFAS
jgi:hypothetical protein